jgi:outer membrane protein
MKRAIVIAAFGIQAVLSHASAQPLKIGLVDVQKVLQESAPSQAAGARLDREFGGRSRELVRLEARLREETDKLEKESAVISEADRSRRTRELTQQKRELERKAREFQDDAERRQQEEQRLVKERFEKAVKKIFDAGKYDLILQANAQLHGPAVDITRKVLDAMAAQK